MVNKRFSLQFYINGKLQSDNSVNVERITLRIKSDNEYNITVRNILDLEKVIKTMRVFLKNIRISYLTNTIQLNLIKMKKEMCEV